MKISRTVIIIILSGIYIGLVLSGAFRKLEYLEGDEPVIQNTPTASPEEVAARYEGAEEEREEALETVMNSIGPSPETATDEASDTKNMNMNMNIGIGISVGVLALFLILFTYYKLRRRY